MPADLPTPQRPSRSRARRRENTVDALMCALASLVVLTVLFEQGDLFILLTGALPVAVMMIGSIDPPGE